ncbi:MULTISPECIES: ribokinase [unclassified Paenibacillus]|uniref:ribokinase n=1 Tax=unclassified Paenibacillus TaxID=185978 RepID=UPI001C0F3BD3|nr:MULTISPECIES: ribokinase [unclassified Paenibacillus]MBU5444404.1 ribokinase [Paenibacillus sp. MSJ-34]CAH0120169.1 Ribokinase [Paenibacillus sp. CECT 9249]
MNVIVIGSANMDMVTRTGRIPEIGETIQGEGFFLSPGGKGANQAVACAKMGAQTWLMGKVGDDIFGQSLLDRLAGYGVRTDYIAREPNVTTGVAAITVYRGNNSIILDGGANSRVTPDYVLSFKRELLAADAVMLQLEIPMETVYETVRLLKGKVPVFLNPAPAAPIDDDILRGVDYFTPNEIECRLYADMDIRGADDAFAALDRLRVKGIRYPLITLGEKGVAYYNGTENVYKPARKVKPVDTTAAGDTFSGTLAAMIVAGKSMDEAVTTAQLASSIAVTRMGAQEAIPALAELTDAQ